MIGLFVFLAIIVLAVTSIGMGPIPGWWDKSYTGTGTVVDGGRPTLDVLPAFVDGDGFASARTRSARTRSAATTSPRPCAGPSSRCRSPCSSAWCPRVIGTLGGLGGRATSAGWSRTSSCAPSTSSSPSRCSCWRRWSPAARTARALTLGLLLGIIVWTSLARLVRGEVLSLKEREFVEAARAMGASPARIIWPAHPAQHHLDDHRQRDADHRRGDPAGDRAELPRLRRAGARHQPRPPHQRVPDRLRHPARGCSGSPAS